MKYVKGFDTIRALAVAYVIVDHWGPFFKEHTVPAFLEQAFFQGGLFGVNLFFVLSGYLITAILLNEKAKSEQIGGANKFTIIKNFFARRSLRIFPIYYLAVFLCVIFNFEYVREHIWYFLTYTSNLLPYWTNEPNEFSHTWSLAVEEQFYLIWPWLIIFINKKYLKYVFGAAIVIGVVSKYMALYMFHHKYPVLVINRLDSFGVGGLYAYIRLNVERNLKFEKAFRIVFPFLLYLAWRMTPFGGIPVCVMYARFLDNLIAIALIMFAINNKYEWMRRYVLENPALNFIGKISYGIYLYHFTLAPSYDGMVNTYVRTHPGVPAFVTNFYFAYSVKLTLLLLVCWLSFVLIEQPIMKLKKKFEYTSK